MSRMVSRKLFCNSGSSNESDYEEIRCIESLINIEDENSIDGPSQRERDDENAFKAGDYVKVISGEYKGFFATC